MTPTPERSLEQRVADLEALLGTRAASARDLSAALLLPLTVSRDAVLAEAQRALLPWTETSWPTREDDRCEAVRYCRHNAERALRNQGTPQENYWSASLRLSREASGARRWTLAIANAGTQTLILDPSVTLEQAQQLGETIALALGYRLLTPDEVGEFLAQHAAPSEAPRGE